MTTRQVRPEVNIHCFELDNFTHVESLLILYLREFYNVVFDMTETSDSELTYDSDDSEYNFNPGVYNIRNFEEEDKNDSEETVEVVQESSVQPYCDESLADEEWLKEYRKMKDLEDKLQIELKK